MAKLNFYKKTTSINMAYEKMEMNAFLVKVNKKSIDDKISERSWKKKIQYKTIAKDSSLVTLDLTHYEEDLSIISTKLVILSEQIVKELIPVCKSVTSSNKSPVKSFMVISYNAKDTKEENTCVVITFCTL
ncbi:hypothetical protein C1645_732312 [Glomus cerebriforme]|uniref:Uncharacterized protein n=1 Tax=Glomus cerebriforme TaxID=658196 RepID=A0A397TRU6_9GLOM|nr:hypothetical protein C1645_732312 [Glomus cerebriforme]